jgi:MFS family permease
VTEPSPAGRRTSFRPAIGLLVADGMSVTGNSVVAVAIPWLVLERTGNAALAGLVAAASLGPLVVSAFLGGAIIDRFGHKRSSIVSDLLSAAAVAAIPLIDGTVGLEIWGLIILVALGAMFDGPGMGAREALTFDVSARTGISLERLTSLRETIQGVGQLAGPGIAGVLIFVLGAIPTLWATAALFTAGVIVLASTVPYDTPSRATPESVREPFWAAVVVGVRYVWRDRTLRAIGLTAAAILLFITPLESVVLPAHFIKTGDARDLGIVLSAFAVGGIVGSLGYGALARRLRRRPLLLGTLAATSGAIALFALLPGTGMLAAIGALVGLVAGPIGPLASVIVQERTAGHLRGRTISTINSIGVAGAPTGVLLAGPLVQSLGVAATLSIMAIGLLAISILAMFSRGLREIERID